MNIMTKLTIVFKESIFYYRLIIYSITLTPLCFAIIIHISERVERYYDLHDENLHTYVTGKRRYCKHDKVYIIIQYQQLSI